MKSASQPVSVLLSGVPVSVYAPPDMVAQAGLRLSLPTPRRIQFGVRFAQTNAAFFALYEMFPQSDDVGNRQPLAHQKEPQFIGGEMCSWHCMALKDI